MTTAVIEAMATGLPVIATLHSGFPDQVIPGKNGYLAREADPADLAQKILEYIEHPERWIAMSKEARALSLEKYDRTPLIARQHELYGKIAPGVTKVVFVAGLFPAISETWFINQIADLIDRGIDVQIYALERGAEENISERYFDHKMKERTIYLDMPKNFLHRIFLAIPKFFRVLREKPSALRTIFNISQYGANAYSGKILFWAEPFLNCDAQLIHCHFGTTANRFLIVREALGLTQPLLTSFYGFDISHIPKIKGASYYDRLKKECTHFIVMSNNMKNRVEALGFSAERLEVLPISVDVKGFPHAERSHKEGEPVRIISVGRFVEKKGFDDLLCALLFVRQKATRPILLTIVGGPKEEEEKLRALANELGVSDLIEWKGYMKSQDVTELYLTQHLYVQASKTAKNGDME